INHRSRIPVPPASMPGLRLAKNDRKAAAAKAEALRNPSCHGHFAAVARHAKVLAVDPHGSTAVINLEHSAAQYAIRAGDSAGNRYIFIRILAWVTLNVGDLGAWRTTGEKQDRSRQSNRNDKALSNIGHEILHTVTVSSCGAGQESLQIVPWESRSENVVYSVLLHGWILRSCAARTARLDIYLCCREWARACDRRARPGAVPSAAPVRHRDGGARPRAESFRKEDYRDSRPGGGA